MKNIVIIGGGTGTFTLLSGLRKFPSNNTVVVSSADDGGSTGALRKELGVFPPGDLRQCLIGLSYTDKSMTELFSYRFEKGNLSGHSVGNIILAALEKTTGSVELAVEIASKMLNVRGQVLPVSLNPTTMTAVYANGKIAVGEHNIDEPKKNPGSRIKQLKLSPAKVNPKALAALGSADAIVFGPGDLYTSIIPNLLVPGMAKAIKESKAQKILVVNIMTKKGQTDSFKASDFVSEFQKYSGIRPDVALVNIGKPAGGLLSQYKKHKAVMVQPDEKNIQSQVITGNFIATTVFEKSKGDKLQRSVLRHDSDKLAKIIWELLQK